MFEEIKNKQLRINTNAEGERESFWLTVFDEPGGPIARYDAETRIVSVNRDHPNIERTCRQAPSVNSEAVVMLCAFTAMLEYANDNPKERARMFVFEWHGITDAIGRLMWDGWAKCEPIRPQLNQIS